MKKSNNTTKSGSQSTSKPQGKSTEPSIDDLKGIQSKRFAAGVEKTEGINGSSVEPVHHHRKIKCYQITEQELDSITLVNIGISIFVSIGSFLLAFWLDIFKDTLLADQIPAEAAIAVSYIKPICLILGIVFWLGAAALFVWRRGFISNIRTQSIE